MTEEFTFTVYGVPAPGGSKTAFPIYKGGKLLLKNGRPILRYADAGGKRNREWKKAVMEAAKAMFHEKPWTFPIEAEFHFTMPRPKSHYRTGQRASELREDVPGMHFHAPDTTKLIRSTEDALTGILWADDGLIVRQLSSKRYGCRPGVSIVMRKAVAGVVEHDRIEKESGRAKIARMKQAVRETEPISPVNGKTDLSGGNAEYGRELLDHGKVDSSAQPQRLSAHEGA